MSGCMDSDPMSLDESVVEDLVPIHMITKWKTLDFSDIPPGLASRFVELFYVSEEPCKWCKIAL